MTESETGLETRISSGKAILVVEVNPPKGGDPAPMRATAKRFAGKVHAVGVSDNRHGVCMSALAAAGIIAAEGVEPILHAVTRDRNRVALLSNCLGAQALGVRNILCTSGTHQTLGVCRPAKNVFDIDPIILLKAIAQLGTMTPHADAGIIPALLERGNHSRATRPADAFEGAGPFCLGAVAAPFADPAELQLIRLAKKVHAGAKFLITQPVYDLERFRAWWGQVTQRGLDGKVAILAGIRPLLDAEDAKAYAASRPFPMVPQALLDRLSSAGDKKAQRAAGIEVALETMKQIAALEGVRGFQICAEDDEQAALEIVERSGVEIR